MAVIRINNFGGEMPRVSPRALPVDLAQVNSNLLATATEFRPLLADSVPLGTAPAGAKTLYRLSKDASGVERTLDTSGWIAEVADKAYVKGQINDDGTERTYVTFNDGTQMPRAMDALGANRQLGVPAPFLATAVLVPGVTFTNAQAIAWSDGTLTPALHAAFLASLPAASASNRMSGGLPLAGAFSMYSMVQNGASPWMADRVLALATAKAAGLNEPTLDPQLTGSTLSIQVHCLPAWGVVANTTTLATAIRAIQSPRDGAQLFTEPQISTLVAALVQRFEPTEAGVKTLRTALDVQVKAVQAAIDFVLTPPTLVTAPTAPVRPNVPEFTYTGGAEGGEPVRSSAWAAYDAAVLAYNIALRDFSGDVALNTNEVAGKIVAIVAAKAAAARLTTEIEALYTKRRDTLLAWIKELVAERGIAKSAQNPGGLVSVDADRIIDTRFYIVTYVNDWGEESAPSPPTAAVDVDQYAKVTVGVAAFPTTRFLVGWRIYRSNTGSTGAAFQALTDTDPAKVVLLNGGFNYFRMAVPTYLDGKKSSELGEACPTLTWLEPPYRMQPGSVLQPIPAKGSEPYLRGLVGMPNGIMAGFIDNFVAFCDPYHPYAWPVEYQKSLKYPVVGLGVFGQSLFVGTSANPSIISGSDSASMSEQVLDDAQACLSARSIVSLGGGVLYASPDGICFASSSAVQVITSALFAREDWQALSPSSIVAAAHEGIYYFWFSGTYGGITGGCLALDMVAKKLARVDIGASAVFADSLSDAVFYVSGTQIKRAFSTGRRTGKWKSGKLLMPAPAPLAWLQVDGDQSSANPATVRWYGDDQLRHTAVVTSITPVRLPAGRWLEHEIELESTARITRVTLAGSTQELQQA